MKRGYLRYSLIGIFIICVSALLTSCGTGSGGDDGVGTTTSITLSVGSSSIPADGFSSVAIQVTLTDATGQAVDTDTSVAFSTTLGHFNNGAASYTVKTPDNTGTVIVSLTAGTIPGTAQITCSSRGVTQLITVTFTTATIILTADPDTILADGVSSSTITAELKDASGQAVATGTAITFYTTRGRFPNGATSYTMTTPDATGIVTVSLTSSTTVGDATVTAQANGITQTVTVFFSGEGVAGVTASITLTADPDTIPADGGSSSAITATLKDSNGDPVSSGTSVTFSATLGRFANGSTSYTATTPGDTGTVIVSLIAGTTPGNAVVTASSGGVSQTVIVMFTGEDVPATPSSLSLSLSQASVKSDNSDSSTITAMVLDSNNAVITGIAVTFSSDGGQLSAAIVETDENGEAKVVFSSGTIDKSNRVVTITATVSGLTPRQIPVQVTGTTLSLSTDTTNLEIGGQNQATLTITARDYGLVPIYDAQVTITASPPNRVQLNPSTGNTDVSGKLEVTVTGTQVGDVKVQVEALGATATQDYTVGAIGAVFTIIHPATDPFSWHTEAALATTGPLANVFSFNDNAPPAQDTITRAGGDFTVDGFAVDDEIMVVGSASNDGVYTIDAIPDILTLTLVESDSLTTEAAALGFTVIITNGVLVRVNAPNQNQVEFATTLGVWDGVPGDMVVTRPVNLVTSEAEAVLSSSEAGTANILVSDAADPSTQDTLAVTFSAPSSEAAKISLQASSTIVAPSVGGVTNSVTLTATVKNATDQVVGGAPVAFSIENPTGGGEYVSPPIVYTDIYGIAESTFTSGSLSSDAEGVTVIARVVGAAITGPATFIAFNDSDPDTIVRSDVGGSFTTDGFVDDDKIRVIGSVSNDGTYTIDTISVAPADTLTLVATDFLTTEAEGERVIIGTVVDSLSIVIGGTAGSVVIGRSTSIYSINNDTAYRLPMSVQVSDSNGNPMSGAEVSLSAWPLQYATGCWLEDDDGNCTLGPCCGGYGYTFYDNEDDFWVGTDMYRNLILDPGEDANMDGELTPPNSAAGSVPATVTTDENGVADFDLVYLKSSAGWIKDEITANTLVYGTETQGTYTFILPWSKPDAENCVLPSSPYTTLHPTADFTWIDQGGSDLVDFFDASFAPEGTSITGWSWVFTGGAPGTSAVQNPPNISFGAAGNYNVSLTVTNNLGQQHTIPKTITVP